MSSVHDILPLDPAYKEQAVQTLTNAYLDDPVYRHFFANADEQAAGMSKLWNVLVTYSLKFGEVYTTSSVEGIACWLPPHRTSLTIWRLMNTGLAGLNLIHGITQLRSPSRKQVNTFFTHLDQLHEETEQPHWYLWTLGVASEAQGQGIGTALIMDMFPRADKNQHGIYLETQKHENVLYYERFGFEVLKKVDVPNLDFEATIWSMWREPQS